MIQPRTGCQNLLRAYKTDSRKKLPMTTCVIRAVQYSASLWHSAHHPPQSRVAGVLNAATVMPKLQNLKL